MAKINLKHDPLLTIEKLETSLSSFFEPKGYEVRTSRAFGGYITVKKSGWTGVIVKLKQKTDSTFLRINGYAPSIAVRLLLYGLITILILLPKWRNLEDEVKEYVISQF
jgi:hypothetical protein